MYLFPVHVCDDHGHSCLLFQFPDELDTSNIITGPRRGRAAAAAAATKMKAEKDAAPSFTDDEDSD